MTNVPVTKLVSTEFAKILVTVAKAQSVSYQVIALSVDVLKGKSETHKLLALIQDANQIQSVQIKRLVSMELVSILA